MLLLVIAIQSSCSRWYSSNIASRMQVVRLAESFPSASVFLLLRRSAHSILPSGSLALQCGAAVAEMERSSSSINGRSEGGDLLSSGGVNGQLCGRGDKKTKRGKRFKGTFGNCRHRMNWENQRLREKWEIPAGPAPESLLPHPFTPLLTRY